MMVTVAAETEISSDTVVCLYMLDSEESLWSFVEFLRQAASAVYGTRETCIDVVVVTVADECSSVDGWALGLQKIPGGLSLLKAFGSCTLCESMGDAERLLSSFGGVVVCQNEYYEFARSVVPRSRRIKPLQLNDLAEFGPIRPSDLNVSDVASDFLKAWIQNQCPFPELVTITFQGKGDDPLITRVFEGIDDWANRSDRTVVPINLQSAGGAVDTPIKRTVKECPGVVQNIELRVALYRRALLNVIITSEQGNTTLPPAEYAAVVIGDGDFSKISDRAVSLPVTATAEDIAHAADQAIYQTRIMAATSDFQLGEKQMTASVDEFYTIAVRYLQSGGHRVRKAIEILKKILQKDSAHADSWALLGLTAHLFKRHEDAIGLFETAISLNPNDAAYFFNLGNAHRAIGNGSDAISAMNAALELDPTMYEAYDVLAEIYLEERDHSLALECLDRASELRGRWKPSSGLRAECFSALGDQSRALECMDQYMSYLLDNKENEDAAISMIWPWCAKLYSSRDAMFLADYRGIGARPNANPAIPK